MVKGMSRRVVVIDSPEPNFFEQAIFIVKNDAFSPGVSERQIVDEARSVVQSYLGSGKPPRKKAAKRLSVLSLLLGAGGIGLVWALSLLF